MTKNRASTAAIVSLCLLAAPLAAAPAPTGSTNSECAAAASEIPGNAPARALKPRTERPARERSRPTAAAPAGCQGMPEGASGSSGMSMAMPKPATLIEEIVSHTTSGTSAEPDSTPTPMLMTQAGNWQLMLHGVAFMSWIGESGPRGHDRAFSTNWIMPMAQRQIGPGTLTLRAMLSLEPLTVTRREYPELFQLGETAYGNPIADGQHPHNFFMEVAASYDLKLSESTLLSLYAAPVGAPALGPTAFPHRASAAEDPIAALGHHLEDSTHISDDVVTAGLAYRWARLEVSGFHGREPDEFRWDIDSGRIDSWSGRFTLNPAPNWSAQYSLGVLKSPEALSPGENTLRMTASVMYNRPLKSGNWAATLLWGRNRTQGTGEVYNGYLAESTLRFRARNYVWERIENVDRTNVLLLGGKPEPRGFEEHFLARVQAYTVGYDRDISLIPHLETALGGQVTLYNPPAALAPIYGAHPSGVVLFLRVRASGDDRP